MAQTNYDAPVQWPTPNWHPDYGDAAAELDQLRALAQAILARMPKATVGLTILEPGYMYLDVQLPNEISVEIHVVPPVRGHEIERFGLFLENRSDEEEEYSHTVDGALDIITRFVMVCDRERP